MSTQAKQAKQLFITNHGPGAFPGYFSGDFFGARGTSNSFWYGCSSFGKDKHLKERPSFILA